MKLLFLVLHVTKEWKMPQSEWTMAKAQFAILFEERFATTCSSRTLHRISGHSTDDDKCQEPGRNFDTSAHSSHQPALSVPAGDGGQRRAGGVHALPGLNLATSSSWCTVQASGEVTGCSEAGGRQLRRGRRAPPGRGRARQSGGPHLAGSP